MTWQCAVWISLPLVSTAVLAGDFDGCRDMFAGGVPPVWTHTQSMPRAMCFDGFAVLYCGDRKTPCFVAEALDADRIQRAKGVPRTNHFFADARLPEGERATLADYAGAKEIDRGHMGPAGDMDTDNRMAQCFSLANIVPQNRQNNEHAWKEIEAATRKYVLRARGRVFVMTGPVFDGKPQTIGAGRVWVPTHLFKLVYDETSKRAWAHWIDNSATAQPGKPISYAELTRRLKVPLLPHAVVLDRDDDATPEAMPSFVPPSLPATSSDDTTCHVGPRGGRYRWVHGKKHYGC